MLKQSLTSVIRNGLFNPVPGFLVYQSLKGGEETSKAIGFKHSQTKTMVQKKRKRSTKAKKELVTKDQVKKMMRRDMEMKVKSSYFYHTDMTTASIYTANLTAQITQGTADGNRIGDVINLQRLDIVGQYTTKVDTGVYYLRFLVFYSGEEYNPDPLDMLTSGFAYTDLYYPTIYAGHHALGCISNKNVTLLHDGLICINSSISSVREGTPIRVSLNLKDKKFQYQGGASAYGKTQNLYVVAGTTSFQGGVDTISSVATTGSLQFNYALKFTDA